MLKKAVTPGSFLKNYLFTLLIVFLPLFMFGVFGPSEIFFGNYSEFGFIYREFGWKFLGISVVLAPVSYTHLDVYKRQVHSSYPDI